MYVFIHRCKNKISNQEKEINYNLLLTTLLYQYGLNSVYSKYYINYHIIYHHIIILIYNLNKCIDFSIKYPVLLNINTCCVPAVF